jgi:hypothetical protein
VWLIDKRRNKSCVIVWLMRAPSARAFDQQRMAKKMKPSLVDFTVDHSAASLAESWLENMKSSEGISHSEDAEISNETKQPRPARMGLGAKFCPHPKSQSEKAVSESLGNIKKRSVPDLIFRSKSRVESDDDEEKESRTKIIKQKVPTQVCKVPDEMQKSNSADKDESMGNNENGEKKKKKKNKKDNLQSSGTDKTVPIDESLDTHIINEGIGIDNEGHTARSTSLVNTVGISAIRAEELSRRPPRRRRIQGKKTRSKQKNIRKDNRPDHLKPGFQCPPTL